MDFEKTREALDTALRRITNETGLVGGALNIVQDGKIVFSYEYGYADRENGVPMTQDNLFDVASTSKAWTVMLAAQAVDEGLMTWDEPIQKHIPEFTMIDAYAGAHLSARDMASHRSGLANHDLLREKIPGDRQNLMRKTAFLEMDRGFRERYEYNNHLFILLGYLVEVLRGMLWEDQIVRYIAEPLGIDTIRFRGIDRDMDKVNPALPYASDGYRATRCGYAANYHSAPCGGIRITMPNMAKWIAAMSRGGMTADGGRLCSEAQYREIITPVIPAEEEGVGLLKRACYAMGWCTADYRGHSVVYHSGGLEGFNTQVGFLPGEDLGYVMCFNTGGTPASEVARAIVLDVLTTGQPADSYDENIDDWFLRRRRPKEKAEARPQALRPLTAAADGQLIGAYRHPAYEAFEIGEDGPAGHLRFRYGTLTAWLMADAEGHISGYAEEMDDPVSNLITLERAEDGRSLYLMTGYNTLRQLFVREEG